MSRSFFALMFFLLFFCLWGTGGVVHAQVYENSQGQLRSLRDEEGTFLLNYDNGELASQILASDGNLVLRQFDDKNRVTAEVFWNSDGSSIELEITYIYDEARIVPLSETRWFTATEQLVVRTFTPEGLMKNQKTYTGSRNPEEGILTEDRNWAYDSQNRLKTETVEVPEKNRISRTEYSWDSGLKNPDEKVYENNVLVRETCWSSDTEYREQLYFGNGFSIVSDYKDGMQVLEIVLQNDTEIRRAAW